MADVEILSEKPVDINELKKELDKIKKRDKELNFRSTRTDEYLQNFVKLKSSEEAYKKLEGLKIPRLKEQHIVKIIDILPSTIDELKTVLQGYTITINNDNLKKIIEALKSFK